MGEENLTEGEPDLDAKLMSAARDGDDGAFREIVLRHHKPLIAFFLRMGLSFADAEDLAQTTFVKLYGYRAKYEARAKFTTFLYLIARQVRIDEIRKRQKRIKILEAMALEYPDGGDCRLPAEEGTGLSDELERALLSLDEAHREVVVLGMLEEMPYSQVSEILSIPVGTVKSRMHHALRQLRKALGKWKGT